MLRGYKKKSSSFSESRERERLKFNPPPFNDGETKFGPTTTNTRLFNSDTSKYVPLGVFILVGNS